MNDWIPMKFRFDYKRYNGSFDHYYCEATTKAKEQFKVAKAGEDTFFIEDYSVYSLTEAMENGSLINGLTIQELQAAVSASEEDIVTDISDFI